MDYDQWKLESPEDEFKRIHGHYPLCEGCGEEFDCICDQTQEDEDDDY